MDVYKTSSDKSKVGAPHVMRPSMFPGGALLRTPTIDNEGYLVSPSEWTEDWARETAETMGVALTVEHWEAIRFMRAFYDTSMATS